MRLIYTTSDQLRARALSSFLTSEGIENQLDLIPNTDWGSQDYGNVEGRIWVIDEDNLEKGKKWAEEFEKNPDDPLFANSPKPAMPFFSPPLQDLTQQAKEVPAPSKTEEGMGAVTLYIFLLCVLLFLYTEFSRPALTHLPPKGVPLYPVAASTIEKKLLYDYPLTYQLVDKFINIYGIQGFDDIENLPAAGKVLLKRIINTPYWDGYYDILVSYFKEGAALKPNAPLFVKERQGEVWRIVTPIFLHGNWIHIIFNMLWLIVVGKQLEQKIGSLRYLLFILLVAVISNTAQYLMSGEDFLGISGVICGMVGFIWMRRIKAPWEGYRLDKSTINLLALFVAVMALIQLVYFVLEASGYANLSIGIANSAHIAGGLAGAALGSLDLFAHQNLD